MNWLNKSWARENVEFAPKRKVDNKGSRERPHVMGAFFSQKMTSIVEYHSLTEWAFYSLLELEKATVRYYVQPIEIQVPYKSKSGKLKSWTHIPDVLVFREGSVPYLYQVKESPDDNDERLKVINKACKMYAESRGWDYSVIYPKSLPNVLSKNIDFLSGFTKKRKWFDSYTSDIFAKLRLIKQASITELAQSFTPKYDPLLVLPVIYHLIAIGSFSVNINERINEYSTVQISSEIDHYLLHMRLEESK